MDHAKAFEHGETGILLVFDISFKMIVSQIHLLTVNQSRAFRSSSHYCLFVLLNEVVLCTHARTLTSILLASSLRIRAGIVSLVLCNSRWIFLYPLRSS